MKRTTSIALAAAVAFLGTGCGKNYSNGERSGVVTKLSKKGLVFESWEGELVMALPIDVAVATQPEKFWFNVDPGCVDKVQAALRSGKRVTLTYRQWCLQPPTIGSPYVVTDVKQ